MIVEQVHAFGRCLVEGIRSERPHGMVFVHRYALDPAELHTRSRVQNEGFRVIPVNALQHVQMPGVVDVGVEERVFHAVVMTNLARQVEDDVLPLHQYFHRLAIANIGDVDLDVIDVTLEIEPVRAVRLNACVHNKHLRTKFNSPDRNRAPNHPHPPGDQDLLSSHGSKHILHPAPPVDITARPGPGRRRRRPFLTIM